MERSSAAITSAWKECHRASRSAASSRDRGRDRSPPCRYGRAAGRGADALEPAAGSPAAAAESGGTMRSPDGIMTSDGTPIFDAARSAGHRRSIAGAQAGCRRTSRSGIRAPSDRRAARPRSTSPPAARTRAPRRSAGPCRAARTFIASHGSSDQNSVCRMSTGNSPTWSATRASIGPADSRKAWPVRSAWKSQGANRARPATRRGWRAASATVSAAHAVAHHRRRAAPAWRRRRGRVRGGPRRPSYRSGARRRWACPSRRDRAAGPRPPWRAAGSSPG